MATENMDKDLHKAVSQVLGGRGKPGLVIVIQETDDGDGELVGLHGTLSRIKALAHLDIIHTELIDQYRGNNQHILEEN
jgi:hypothetical protein